MRTKPLPIRFDPDLTNRIDSTARKMGLTRTAIIKTCVSGFLEVLEHAIPPAELKDLQALLRKMDGRHTRYERARVAAEGRPVWETGKEK